MRTKEFLLFHHNISKIIYLEIFFLIFMLSLSGCNSKNNIPLPSSAKNISPIDGIILKEGQIIIPVPTIEKFPTGTESWLFNRDLDGNIVLRITWSDNVGNKELGVFNINTGGITNLSGEISLSSKVYYFVESSFYEGSGWIILEIKK